MLGGSPTSCPRHGAAAPDNSRAVFAGGSAPRPSCLPSLTPLLSTPQGPAVSDGGKAAPRIVTRGGGSPAVPGPPCSDGALGAGSCGAGWVTQSPVAPRGGCLFAKSCLALGRTRRAGSRAAICLLCWGATGTLPPSHWLCRGTPPVRPDLRWQVALCSPLSPVRPDQELAGRPWGLPSFRRRAAFECSHLCSPRLPLRPGLTISVPPVARDREAEKGIEAQAWS